jgi:cytochrome c
MKNTITMTLAALAAAALAHGQAFAQSDAKRGEKMFDECRACHAIDGSTNAVGPSLKGVVGRRSGALDEFRYSPAMKRANLTWNRDTLDAFIADPQKMVPANRMPYSGIPDAKSRADIIEYLQTLK